MVKLKAFTLIELIVVIAIIGVLAAILVPSMIGYVGDSKYSTANANAKLAYSTAAQWSTRCEVEGNTVLDGSFTVNDLTIPASAEEVSYVGSDMNDLAKELCRQMGGKAGSGMTCGYFYGQMPKWCQWRKTSSDNYVGSYPMESTMATPATWGVELT